MKSSSYKFMAALIILLSIIGCKEGTKKVPSEEVPLKGIKAKSPKDQIVELMEMWPGTYNNDKQIAQVIKDGGKVWRFNGEGKGGYLELQSHYIKLNNPEIGENVLYVEEYRGHQPDSTYRQRIYTINVDSTNTIRVKMYPFKDKKKYVGAWRDVALLHGLKADEIIAFPDICDLQVEKDGDVYYMRMNGEDCAFGDRVFNYEVRLSKDVFSYHDKISSKATGETIETAADYAYHNLDRIK